MSDLAETQVRIKGSKLQSLISRFLANGFVFKYESRSYYHGVYSNTNADANIQQVRWGHSGIDPNRWIDLIIKARRPDEVEKELLRFDFIQTDDIISDQEIKAELERDLRRQREYWRETIRPYITNPMRDLVQWYISHDAHARLRQASTSAWRWNHTPQGQQFAVPPDAFPDLASDEFREPDPLCKDENLKRQLEAVSPPTGLSPDQAVRWVHEYYLARQRYIESLPEEPHTVRASMELAFTPITFDQIIHSNETAGQLPLLPPVPVDGSAQSSKEKIKKIVVDFLEKHASPLLTKEEFARRQSQRHADGESLTMPDGKLMTYEDYVADEQRDINNCRNHERVLLMNLCRLRQKRFDEHGHAPKLTVVIGKPPGKVDENQPPILKGEPASVKENQLGGPESDRILSLGRLRYTADFHHVWVSGKLFDLSTRNMARGCLKYLVEQKAFAPESARQLNDEIDPYVREHAGDLPRAHDIKIQHYFGDRNGQLAKLCKEIIRVVKGTGRYYLALDQG